MKKKPYSRGNRARKLFSVALFLSWIGFMALAGFFVPSFLTQLPFFQIKRVEVKGNYRIPFEEVREAVHSLSGNLMKLRGPQLRDLLNARFENRVKRVELRRKFTREGIVLEVSIEERVPVARLRLGRSYRLLDREGVIFKPLGEEGKGLVEISTYDKEVLLKGFPRLYEEVLSLRMPLNRILIKKDRVVLELEGRRIVLPPLEFFSDSISERLRMIYNFPQEKVDLRYDRFILVRN